MKRVVAAVLFLAGCAHVERKPIADPDQLFICRAAPSKHYEELECITFEEFLEKVSATPVPPESRL